MTVPGAIADLSGPSAFEYAVLVQPWPLAGGLALAGVIGLVLLGKRGFARGGVAVLTACVVLAAAVVVAANRIETRGERLAGLTRDFIAACAKIDESAIGRLSGTDVALEIPVLHAGATQQELIALLRDELGRYPIASFAVTRMSWSVDGQNLARTRCRVVVEPEARALPVGVWVTITWRQGQDGHWKARTIRADSAERGE